MSRLIFILLILLYSSFAGAADEAPFPDPSRFPVPEAYENSVKFWMRVYGEWDEGKMVIHDSRNMDIVFDVVEYPDENSLLRSAARAGLSQRIAEIKGILQELDADRAAQGKSPEHKRINDLYKDVHDPDKFRKAVENLRVQQGIKDRFEFGLEQMTRYIGQLKMVMRNEGIPEEIAYLPLVESSFNNQSLSKTRAAGIWQFMPGTARLYMKVNNDVDERLDPYVASRSAARYLKRSYQLFGNWPVALTSYNHGQQGMMNAVRQMGTADYMTIWTRYQGKYFGFASRNFYGEFIAACRVMKQADQYFKDLDYQEPHTHSAVKLAAPLSVSSLLQHSQLSREDLRDYNPALQSSVVFGRRPIPAGYELRLPASKFPRPEELIAKIRSNQPAPVKKATYTASNQSAKTTPRTYVVRKGDTLFSISQKFATTIEAIRRLNGLSHSTIIPGQRLSVPSI
jgi:membrane-bound lytic murein transglycosylase D